MSAPRTDWTETVQPDEAERFARLAAELRATSARSAGQPGRALHAKTIAGVRAEFAVLDQLPAAARAGIFAAPGAYRAYVRFSNGAATRQADTVSDVRGLAIKLLGVPGTKLLPGLESATTQDYLTIHSPFTPFASPEEFVWVARAAQQKLTFLPRAILHLGLRRTLSVIGTVKRDLNRPFPSFALADFFSGLAIRWGDYAARYALAPVSADEAPASGGSGADYLRADLADRLRRGPLHYDFRLQFYTGEDQTPIENTAVVWPVPFVTVARLTIPQQDIDDDSGRRTTDLVEQMSFDPWHAPEAFRPLGAMMLARRAAYRESALGRNAAAEPPGSDWIA